MTIVELAERSGVPTATIKYYVREGLLSPGERLSGTRTDYADHHLRRLRLIRAMLEVGNLSTTSVREVLSTLDAPELDIAYAFEVAQRSLGRGSVEASGEPTPTSRQRIDDLAQRAGWVDCSDNIGRDMAARVLDAGEAAGLHLDDSYLDGYAAGAAAAAGADISALHGLPDRNRTVEVMVIGTVFGDPLAAGLRRMAQEHFSRGLGR